MGVGYSFVAGVASPHAFLRSRLERDGCYSGDRPCRIQPDRRAQEPEGGNDEQQWAHALFRPLLQDVLEDLHAGKLAEDEYPYIAQRPPPGADRHCASQMSPDMLLDRTQLIVEA